MTNRLLPQYVGGTLTKRPKDFGDSGEDKNGGGSEVIRVGWQSEALVKPPSNHRKETRSTRQTSWRNFGGVVKKRKTMEKRGSWTHKKQGGEHQCSLGHI